MSLTDNAFRKSKLPYFFLCVVLGNILALEKGPTFLGTLKWFLGIIGLPSYMTDICWTRLTMPTSSRIGDKLHSSINPKSMLPLLPSLPSFLHPSLPTPPPFPKISIVYICASSSLGTIKVVVALTCSISSRDLGVPTPTVPWVTLLTDAHPPPTP